MVSINRELNLVVPLLREDGTTIYIHSTPIRPETFDTYYLVLAKTFASLNQQGLDPRFAPSVAARMLKDVAISTSRAQGLDWWAGPDGVGGESGLLAEISRLSNAVVAGPNGWGSIPLQVAIDHGKIDDEEKKDVMNLLVFFTLASRVAPRRDRKNLTEGMAAMYELQTTFSNVTEFANSLKMSTEDEPIGESIPAS